MLLVSLFSVLVAFDSPKNVAKFSVPFLSLAIFTLGLSRRKISTSASFLKSEKGLSLTSICSALKSGAVVFSSGRVTFSSKVKGLNLASATLRLAFISFSFVGSVFLSA